MFLKLEIGMQVSSWSTATQGLRSKDRIKYTVHPGPECQ